jgi:hypothetical protein
MFELERLKAPIYIVFVILAIPLWSDDIELNTTNIEEIRLPPEYEDYANVFSEEEASKFPNFTRVEHSIPIKEGAEVPYSSIYQLREHELGVLRDYLESSQEKEWIWKSEFPADALILFILKKDGGLRLYVDYRGLNKVMIWNRHPLGDPRPVKPREMLHQIRSMWCLLLYTY